MAVIAFCGGAQVRGVFAFCDDAIMACGTDAGGRGMVKTGASPCVRGVAVVTVGSGLYVPRMFAPCSNTVMAAAACASYIVMVKPCTTP